MEQAKFEIVKAEHAQVADIKTDPTYKALVPELKPEEYTRLKTSIQENGLYEPIVINQDHVILDGHHRYKVIKDLGWKIVEVQRKRFTDKLSENIYVIETNVVRRQLNDYQKTILAMQLEEYYSEQARQRQEELGKTHGKDPLGSFEHKGKARDQAAQAVGLTPTTYHRAKKVLEKGTKKDIEKFKQGKQKPYTIYKNIKNEEKIKDLEEKIKDIPPLEGTYDTIVIDPPWNMGKYDQGTFRGGPTYPTMSIEEIKNMNIPASDNCVLWLWTTNRFLHEAYHILEAWGFAPKSVLTWCKDKIGVGVWLRGKTEHCILAIKGKPLWNLGSQSTALMAKNQGHSVKPDEFYELVESLCYGRKLDYFAREKREGWITYGTLEHEKDES